MPTRMGNTRNNGYTTAIILTRERRIRTCSSFWQSRRLPGIHGAQYDCDNLTTNLASVVCVCAKFDQFRPLRSHFGSKPPENFVRIAKFPYAAFGPLFAFHCPLFVTKNNNLGWNRHASPHTGTGAPFTGRRYCLRADNRR